MGDDRTSPAWRSTAIRLKHFAKYKMRGHGIFRDRQCAAGAARGGYGDIAAPQIAQSQIAGAGGTLMKPFEPRRAGAQIERVWPAAENDLRVG